MPNYASKFNINGEAVLLKDSEARTLLNSKADNSALQSLENTVSTKASQADVNSSIGNLENQVNNMGTLVTNLEDTVVGVTPRINSIEYNLSGLNSIANAQSEQIQTLEDRVDAITNLPSGSTSGDAELIDIRNGGNGVVYSSAGDSVRGEYYSVMQELNLANSGLLPIPNSFATGTWNGGTVSWDKSREIFTITGLPTTSAFNVDIYNNSSSLPSSVTPGDVYNIIKTNLHNNIGYWMYVYSNGTLKYTYNLKTMNQVLIPSDATGMILRIQLVSGVTGTYTGTLRLSKVQSDVSGTNKIVYALPSGGGSDYVEPIITALLNKYKHVKLIPGIYYINGTIIMPDDSSIEGSGFSSCIQTLSYTYSGIKMNTNCEVSNLRLVGVSSTISSSPTSLAGIYIEGNNESAPFVLNNKIYDCWFEGWSGGGIKCYHTGYWCANSATITNCTFKTCYAGVWLAEKSEFNRVSDCLCYGNWIGILNQGGNNTIANCVLTENKVGFYLDGETHDNSGHGSCVGCVINHSDNNNGYAIVGHQIANGFTFVGCQIWYGNVELNQSSEGFMMSNCQFGGGTPDIHTDSADGAIILNSCLFKQTPSFTGNVIRNICYNLTGSPV